MTPSHDITFLQYAEGLEARAAVAEKLGHISQATNLRRRAARVRIMVSDALHGFCRTRPRASIHA